MAYKWKLVALLFCCAALNYGDRAATSSLFPLFRTEMGRSPARYYLEIRLDRARHLLIQSSMPVVEVAVACGFVSASHFSKCYRELYARSPQQERVDRKQLLAA